MEHCDGRTDSQEVVEMLTHLSRLELPTVINWNSPFLF